ncbi:MAG TPA: hypothetical protein VLS45_01715, partial [Methylomicrobium sp.]|nr:hypothetical protein [Methylomicrobium sp.]
QTAEKPGMIVTETAVLEEVPVAAAQTAPSAQPETVPDVMLEVFPKPDPACVFPQDSMLRRHFIANLIASAKPYVPTRPTDSMLGRHYDATKSSRQATVGSVHQSAVPAPETKTAEPCRKCSTKPGLPEDSMLRRHYLTTLRVKIESNLSLPSRPTESMLRRHFDAMKEQLIAGELQRYLEG